MAIGVKFPFFVESGRFVGVRFLFVYCVFAIFLRFRAPRFRVLYAKTRLRGHIFGPLIPRKFDGGLKNRPPIPATI